MPVAELAIVGGGIIGLATAAEWLARCPGSTLVVLEKEPQIAGHQTSHNSGVIHSGIYYRPGSLKAKTCVEGARLMVEFCRAHGIVHELCGKLVVATEEAELPALHTLFERGTANGVPAVELIGPERMRELEPHAAGLKALYVPGAGIVDYAAVARAFADLIRQRGGTIRTSARVVRLLRREGEWKLKTSAGEVRSKALITCGGLHADRVCAAAGGPTEVRVAPFRGEYYSLVPSRCGFVHGMIYPVPDPAFPFLGAHFTRAIDGAVHAGPNAVLALKREGYKKSDFDARDTLELLCFAGFWKMARRYWRTGLGEWYRSLSKRAFVRALQRLVPEIRPRDLVPAESGVRAQALSTEGALLDDFDIVQAPHAIYVRNVPSPAATASISIARTIVEMAASAFAQ